MDVKALYPSVPRDKTREAVAQALQVRTDQETSIETILELMDLVLENNFLSFNNKFYVQKEGTAIGSKLGRNYACTYLGEWEHELLTKSKFQPKAYLRYIDDIFGIWEYSLDELERFSKLANSIHPNIQLTLRSSKEAIEFLDVKVILNADNTISTNLFEKETNAHMYLHKNSNHPRTTKENIAYGLALRSKRICSNDNDYEESKHNI